MKCPSCGADASGSYCSSCGSPLAPGPCASCGASLQPGARFCNQCGQAVARSARARATGPAGGNLPWFLLAGALLVIIGLIFLLLRAGPPPQDMAATAPLSRPAAGAGTPPPLTGTPREQADRLFNRIMTALGEGDTANARFFAPMGIQAYEMAGPLDADGLYHLSLIHNVAGDYAAGRAAAERILATNPNHLLGLAAAAEASQHAGDRAAARTYHRRFIEAYETESARELPEYRDHAAILPQHLATARRETGS